MGNRTINRLTLYVILIVLSAILGPIYVQILFPEDEGRYNFSIALDGAIGGLIFWGGVLILWPSRFCASLRRLSFPWHVLFLMTLVAVCIPLTGWISSSVQSGQLSAEIGFGPGWSLYVYILGLTTLALINIQIAKMIGPRVLGNVLIGRFHTPVAESRGEIHAYVGDQAIITWQFKAGANKAQCVRCFFAVQNIPRENAEFCEQLFGVRPEIRASLHGGSEIVSECGDTKKSIVYFGDTMNTSARLEGEAKRLERDLIVSAELLKEISLPPEFAAEALSDVTLRGHDRPTALFALSRTVPVLATI